MADTFAALGLRDELAAAAASAGYARPSPIQADAIPVLRRGGNAVLNASAGAGLTAAYALPLLDRLAEAPAGDAPRALLLYATPELAGAAARAIAPFAAAVGVRVAALAADWPQPAAADIVTTTPARARAGLHDSALKLGGLLAVVFVGLDAMLALGEAEALEAVAAALPREAQRVMTAGRDEAIADFVERHARRAVRFPSRPADEALAPRQPSPAGVPLAYTAVAAGERAAAIARILVAGGAAAARVHCRTRPEAERLAGELALRGLSATLEEGEGSAIRAGGEEETEEAVRVISASPPFDAEELRRRHGSEGGRVLLDARELAHLRRVAAAAGVGLTPAPLAAEEEGAAGLQAFRDAVRRALAEEDVAAQLLVLAPLFEQAGAEEVAGALSALLRRRHAAQPAAAAQAPAEGQTVAPRPPPALTRLFVSLGERDRVGPGDLVGSITGEAQVRGDQVGRIEIRDNFSIVEVESGIADRVIRAMNGTTIRGRSVRVDYDRRGAAQGARPARRQAPRGGPRRRPPRPGGRDEG